MVMSMTGLIGLDRWAVEQLGLANHPMVLKTREMVEAGWRIRISRGPNARTPYTKVFLERGTEQTTIQIDGSILDHWGATRSDGGTAMSFRRAHRGASTD